MVTSLDTENKTLIDLAKPPIIGGYIILLFAVLPVPVLLIINELVDLVPSEAFEGWLALSAGLWNGILAYFYEIRIKVLFIPCWIFFTGLGLLMICDIV